MPDGRIDHELVGTQREVEWWCGTDEGRAAGRRQVSLYAMPRPLGNDEVNALAQEMVKGGKSANWLARAIERAHGIGGELE
jgi:hypothetical protein